MHAKFLNVWGQIPLKCWFCGIELRCGGDTCLDVNVVRHA